MERRKSVQSRFFQFARSLLRQLYLYLFQEVGKWLRLINHCLTFQVVNTELLIRMFCFVSSHRVSHKLNSTARVCIHLKYYVMKWWHDTDICTNHLKGIKTVRNYLCVTLIGTRKREVVRSYSRIYNRFFPASSSEKSDLFRKSLLDYVSFSLYGLDRICSHWKRDNIASSIRPRERSIGAQPFLLHRSSK